MKIKRNHSLAKNLSHFSSSTPVISLSTSNRMASLRVRLSSRKRHSVILLVLGLIWGHFTFLFITSLLPHGRPFPCTLPPFTPMIDSVSDPQMQHDDVTVSPKRLLFVGVMTSRKYLRTRARAIYKTWGASLNGSLVFFVGRGDDVSDDVIGRVNDVVEQDLPVQVLGNVDDSEYPPQKKSFAMLEFMRKEYGESYQWFMRADDDLFVDVRRLRMLLSSLNSSAPLYVGHPGTGRPEEAGRLGLPEGIPYCMGGTGVVLSAALLTSLADSLATCAQNTVTYHEDSELGRCIYNASALGCVQSAKINRCFKQSYDDTTGQWIQKAMRSSQPYVTFHPVKDTRFMYGSAALVDIQRISELRNKVRQLTSTISCLDVLLNDKEPEKIVCTNETCWHKESALCESDKQTHRDILSNNYPNISWFLIHQNVFYTLWKQDMSLPASYGGVWLGVTKILRHLSAYVKVRNRRNKLKQIVLGNFYRRVVPAVGVDYMAFVRDVSSNLHPYVIRQSFDEVHFVEKQ